MNSNDVVAGVTFRNSRSSGIEHGGTLNSYQVASPLVRLVEGEERWETPDHPQGVCSLSKLGWNTEQNHTVTYMVLKAMANDRCKNLAPCCDELSIRLGVFMTTPSDANYQRVIGAGALPLKFRAIIEAFELYETFLILEQAKGLVIFCNSKAALQAILNGGSKITEEICSCLFRSQERER
ncbi:hypothetical protein TNCV_4206371 [Trichonephila clavipes]|nr:hypothetical protein TNCV_4206371 [Trichonephila clavipes]